MRLKALVEFDGDFGTGTKVQRFCIDDEFEAPDVVCRKWISRGLVEAVPTKAAKRPTNDKEMTHGR